MKARPSEKVKRDEGSERWFRVRVNLVGFVFLLAFMLVAGRAYYLQVANAEVWQERAQKQLQRVIPLAPQRGTIYDRNGRELAVSLENDSVYAEPPRVKDPSEAARLLSKALDLSRQELEKKLSSDKGFVWLKRRINPDESLAVRELGLRGIGFTKEHKRYYPNSESAAHVVGFTGLDPQGLEGIELSFDRELLGAPGYLVRERDALGRAMALDGNIVREGELGHHLYLTIDHNIQYMAEKELAAQIRETGARAGTVLVLDPRSGEVLAMAVQPDFNPNALQRYKPWQWRNRAVCDTFEPGSTFKPFVVAAALDEKLVQPETRIDCENGRFSVGGRTIHDHRKYQKLSVEEIIQVSSNIGTAKIGKYLERQKFHSYIRDFGFGEKTGIELPGEVSGLLRAPSKWFEIDLATISFGQGIGVTALQLASATSAIANGGVLMQPYIVSRILDSHGNLVRETRPTRVRRVVSEKTASQVRDMMVLATREGGTGTLAQVHGFDVAGKTGTAQKIDPVTGGYSADKRVSSFVGFVPAQDPRLTILVVLDEPKDKTYGGLVAAPVFSRVATQALRYVGVAPQQTAQTAPPVTPLTHEKDVAVTSMAMTEGGESGDNGPGRMPDLNGMSYRQVLQVMERTGLNIKLQGSGRVVDQKPAAGAAIRYGSEVRVRFEPPVRRS